MRYSLETTSWERAVQKLKKHDEDPYLAPLTSAGFEGTLSAMSPFRSQYNGGSGKALAGCVGELLVCADLMNKGYSVFRAVSHNACCDLVAIKHGKVTRFEVKIGDSIENVQIRNVGQFDQLALVSRKRGISYHEF